ncbi:hypothetical protein KKA15_03075 [Patescibacteria group bacterium]|nr:hypothetical protein [Patescibacteria group bacterium]
MKILHKNTYKIVVILPLLVYLCLTLLIPAVVFASPSDDNYGLDTTVDTGGVTEFAGKESDLSKMAGQFINYVLGIVGTIFFLVILIGGYRWMTAGGSEEKVGAAKKIIVQGIFGMLAIFLAYALAFAIIQALTTAIKP